MKTLNKNAKLILEKLLDKYDRSVLSFEGTSRSIKISLTKKDEPFSTFLGSRSYLYVDEMAECIEQLHDAGFATPRFDSHEEFLGIFLNLDAVEEAIEYLGRTSRKDKIQKQINLLESKSYNSFFEEFRNDSLLRLSAGKKIKNIDGEIELRDVLLAIDFLDSMDASIKERDFSVKVYGDSKRFSSLKTKIASIAKEYGSFESDLTNDDIIEELGITKNSSYVLVKNNIIFSIANQQIDLNEFGYEFSLSDEMISNLNIESIHCSRVVTVENLTTFYQFEDKSAVVIYLGGFHNHTKRDFLKLLNKTKPGMGFYHFGDIDVGGFRILNHLRKDTEINFKPLDMGICQLQEHSSEAKTLTDNDRKQIRIMLGQNEYQEFKEILEYMLTNDIKLEQESLD